MDTVLVMSKIPCSAHFVPVLLWLTSVVSCIGKDIERFYVAWRKCIRKIWDVSNMTHCNLLKHLYGGQAIEVELLQIFASFYCVHL